MYGFNNNQWGTYRSGPRMNLMGPRFRNPYPMQQNATNFQHHNGFPNFHQSWNAEHAAYSGMYAWPNPVDRCVQVPPPKHFGHNWQQNQYLDPALPPPAPPPPVPLPAPPPQFYFYEQPKLCDSEPMVNWNSEASEIPNTYPRYEHPTVSAESQHMHCPPPPLPPPAAFNYLRSMDKKNSIGPQAQLPVRKQETPDVLENKKVDSLSKSCALQASKIIHSPAPPIPSSDLQIPTSAQINKDQTVPSGESTVQSQKDIKISKIYSSQNMTPSEPADSPKNSDATEPVLAKNNLVEPLQFLKTEFVPLSNENISQSGWNLGTTENSLSQNVSSVTNVSSTASCVNNFSNSHPQCKTKVLVQTQMESTNSFSKDHSYGSTAYIAHGHHNLSEDPSFSFNANENQSQAFDSQNDTGLQNSSSVIEYGHGLLKRNHSVQRWDQYNCYKKTSEAKWGNAEKDKGNRYRTGGRKRERSNSRSPCQSNEIYSRSHNNRFHSRQKSCESGRAALNSKGSNISGSHFRNSRFQERQTQKNRSFLYEREKKKGMSDTNSISHSNFHRAREQSHDNSQRSKNQSHNFRLDGEETVHSKNVDIFSKSPIPVHNEDKTNFDSGSVTDSKLSNDGDENKEQQKNEKKEESRGYIETDDDSFDASEVYSSDFHQVNLNENALSSDSDTPGPRHKRRRLESPNGFKSERDNQRCLKQRWRKRSRSLGSESEESDDNCVPVTLSSSLDKLYVHNDEGNIIQGTEELLKLHSRFQYELVERAERVRSTKPKYIPPERKIKLKRPKPPKEEKCSLHTSSSSCESSSEDEEDTSLQELERKKRHPDRLHEELWYNDPGEMNDGPLCRCSAKARRSGIRHSIYAGEEPILQCNPNTNNEDRLYHYSIVVKPDTNFLSRNPTKIKWNDEFYMFEGFSMFTHSPLAELPDCKVIRFNIEYTIECVKERFPKEFTVNGLDLFTQYLFHELLELVDLNWKAHNDSDGCPRFHFMPRFIKVKEQSKDEGGKEEKELLSMAVILEYLLECNKFLVEEHELDFLKSLGKDQWPKLADKVKGMIVTRPGKKPSSIRVDQLDCEACDPKNKIYPVIIHFGVRPPQLSYAGNPGYQKAWRDYVKFRHLLANKPKVHYEDRHRLNRKERRLQDMRLKRSFCIFIIFMVR